MPPTEEANPANPPAASIEPNRTGLTAASIDMMVEAMEKRMRPHFDKLSGEIGVAKQQSRARQGGLTKENAALRSRLEAETKNGAGDSPRPVS